MNRLSLLLAVVLATQLACARSPEIGPRRVAQPIGASGVGGMPPRAGQNQQMAEVVSVAQDRVVLRLPNGRNQPVPLGNTTRVLRHSPVTAGDLVIGDRVLAPGQRGPGGRILSGKVTTLNPMRIKTDQGREITLPDQARLVRETKADADALKPGMRVRAIRGTIIVTADGFGAAGSGPQRRNAGGQPWGAHPMPRRAAGAAGVGRSASRTGANLTLQDLPQPETGYQDHFDRQVVNAHRDSPFGFFDPNMLRFQHLSWNDGYGNTMRALGAYWAAHGASFSFGWNLVQSINGDGSLGDYTWSRLDGLVRYSQAHNIHIIPVLVSSEPEPGIQQGGRILAHKPGNEAAYKAFVSAAVERFDGDGRDDMPNLRFPIKLWVVENEPYAKRYWNGSGADLADTQLLAYQAIKAADPTAKVIASVVRGSGWMGKEDPLTFMNEFFDRLGAVSNGRRPYDYLDLHWIGIAPNKTQAGQYSEVKVWVEDLKQAATRNGFAPAPLVALENAGRHGTQTEHAEDVVKRYGYLLGLGFRTILWSGIRTAPTPGRSAGDNYFRKVTLIDKKNRKNKGYHAYRQMTSRLDGADWSKTRILQDKDGLVVVRFVKEGKPLFLAWSDNPRKTEATIPVDMPRVMELHAEEAIPGTGGDFRTYVVPVANGTATVPLSATPIYLSIR